MEECSVQCCGIPLVSKIDDYLLIEIDLSVSAQEQLKELKLNYSDMVPETWTIGACVNECIHYVYPAAKFIRTKIV